MKKIMLVILILCVWTSCCLANSSSFEYMLDVMEIPKMNPNGYTINEIIYQKYQLFVYGNPEMIISRSAF